MAAGTQTVWLSVTDAARLLGVSRAAVADAHRSGRLRARWSEGRGWPYHRPGREVPLEDAARWAAERAARHDKEQS